MRQMLCPRLVGRDEERQSIEAALDAARQGRGAGMFLLGEAGVGKSRLAREAERMALEAGTRVLWGRSIEDGATAAFGPITEALMSTMRHTGAELIERPELRPFLGILARLIPDWREHRMPPGAPDESLVVLGEAVLRLLRAVGGANGCLLVLEDLHWSDGETLAVLDYLIANARNEQLLVLATSRLEMSSAAIHLARSLAMHRSATIMDLGRLPPVAVRELAIACLDNSALPESVEHHLSRSAEGLPLLVEDLLAEWVGAGALVKSAGGWTLRQGIGPVVPMSFIETVRRRLRVLGAECSAVLQQAALLGRSFDWTLLPAASGLDEEVVLEHLHASVDAQLLLAERNGFRFRHALTREAVLEGLLPVQRSRQATRLLRLVELAYPQLEGEWCELAAALADTAGDRPRAAALLLESGRKSLAQGGLVTAEATLERARSLDPPPELRADIDEELLRVLSDAGKHEQVFEVGEALLLALTRTQVPPVRIAATHLSIAQAAVPAGRLAEANQHLDLARQLDVAGELEARIGALAAHVAIDERRTQDAERLARVALVAADRTGETGVACEALIVLGRLARTRGLDDAEEAFERAYRLAEAHGLAVWRSRALHELGTIDMFRECSPRRLLEARNLAADSGALATVASVDVELAATYALQFRLDDALAAAQRAREAGRRFRLAGVEWAGVVFSAGVHAQRLDRPAMERALAELPTGVGEDALYFGWCRNFFRGEASLCEENRTQARRDFQAAIEFGVQMTLSAPSPGWGEWDLLWSLEHRDAWQGPWSPDWAVVQPVNRGYAQYAAAVRLGRSGQPQEAVEAVERGDRVLVRTPWYFHVGRRLIAEAAIEDGWGNPAGWLHEAEAFFSQHDFRAIASACRSLLRRCGTRSLGVRRRERVPEPYATAGVTDREMEVLGALSQGSSNKEIAAHLYISPKTVEKHVASLMGKLQVRSRTQLAAIVAARAAAAASSDATNRPRRN